MSVIVSEEDKKRYKIRIPYNQELYEKMQSLQGTVWDEENKLWIIPKEEPTLLRVRQLLYRFGIVKKSSQEDSRILGDLMKLMNELRIQGYSNKTIKAYIGHIRRYMKFNPEYSNFNERSIKRYILLLKQTNCSHSYISQLIGSLKFWYVKVKKLPDFEFCIVHPKKEKKLPNVLSKHEIQNIISQIHNLKHKTMIMLIYSAGLRVSEVAQLRVSDINSQRGLIRINQGKGKKIELPYYQKKH